VDLTDRYVFSLNKFDSGIVDKSMQQESLIWQNRYEILAECYVEPFPTNQHNFQGMKMFK
jgi:hypothetical protein